MYTRKPQQALNELKRFLFLFSKSRSNILDILKRRSYELLLSGQDDHLSQSSFADSEQDRKTMHSGEVESNPFGGDHIADEVLEAELADLHRCYWDIKLSVGR